VIQLYVVDWHTGTGILDPTWSIVKGPSGISISSTGLLSLSATASAVGDPVVVMASDGVYSATTQLDLPSSRKTPAIIWAIPKPIISGMALGPSQLNAQTSISGTFRYSPQAGTILSPGPNELTVTFIPDDKTDYNSAQSAVILEVNPFATKHH
jgi:hypothetical protein